MALKDKDGVEIDQGIFLAHVLADRSAGRISATPCCCRAPESPSALPQFERDGGVDLGGARVERAGQGRCIDLQQSALPQRRGRQHARPDGDRSRPRACSIRRPRSRVLRGGAVDHPKYAGRRLFGAGINLTHLYHGKIPFVWFFAARHGLRAQDLPRPGAARRAARRRRGRDIEKPWIAAVEASPSAATASICW